MAEINTVLQNRYLILRRIGQGGMGAVYEARDQRLGSTVALKESIVPGEHLRVAFEREARLLARLRHPALPGVSDHFIDGNGQFLVMQFIPGHDLMELLERKGSPFSPAEALRWGDQLLDALEYLHAQNPPVIHRDIKPNNLKLTERGEIILLDFGLAKGAPQISQVNAGSGSSVMGYTPNYAPPEQIEGAGTDPRSDLYALAATLHHLMTGAKPPDAVVRALRVLNGQEDPLESAHKINPLVPPGVAALLQSAMSLDRERRPADAASMRSALRSANILDQSPTLVAGTEPASSAATVTKIAPTTKPNLAEATAGTITPAAPDTVLSQPAGKTRKWVAIGGAAFVLLLVLVAGLLSFSKLLSGPALPIDLNSASKEKDKPTPLSSKEILGRGIKEARYYTVTAGPGEMDMTLNVIAQGATVYVELFDKEGNSIRFENSSTNLSAGSSGHNEQAKARLYLDNKKPLLMQVTSNYPESIQGCRLRFDGAVELAAADAAGSDSKLLEKLADLFKDRDNPNQLSSKAILGRGMAKDLYYTFTAGPGEIDFTLNVVAQGATVYVELFDKESNSIRFENSSTNLSAGSSGHNEQAKARLYLDNKKPLLMRLSNNYPNSIGGFRLQIGGASELTDTNPTGPDSGLLEKLADKFKDRDNPTPLSSKEIQGRRMAKDLYYTFTAGPGEMDITLNVAARGATVYVELFDKDGNPLRFKNNSTSMSVGSSGNNEQAKEGINLEQKQPLLMRLSNSYPDSTDSYRLQIEGAIDNQ